MLEIIILFTLTIKGNLYLFLLLTAGDKSDDNDLLMKIYCYTVG